MITNSTIKILNRKFLVLNIGTIFFEYSKESIQLADSLNKINVRGFKKAY